MTEFILLLYIILIATPVIFVLVMFFRFVKAFEKIADTYSRPSN